MRLLTPAEIIGRLPENRSVIFVGNAPSLSEERLGHWIDSHDMVVRFNECPVKGFEKDVGSRTEIVVTNPYPEGRQPLSLSKGGTVLIISPQTRRPPSPELESWVSGHDVLFTYAPDLVQVGNVDHKSALTTGVYGVHLLSRLLAPSHISITGFTLFLDDTSHHYWQPVTPKGLNAHEVATEATIFMRVCNGLRCAVEVTEEIAWVGRRVETPLKAGVSIRELKDQRWKT
jgi:hypothetical protein